MNFLSAKKYILNRLEQELPASLYYHGAHHTKDVLAATERLIESEKVSAHNASLLLTAACFHDCGFLVSYKDHEVSGCNIAKEELPKHSYSEDEINIICGMIMATKIPQNPQSHLEQIICDADLEYLGRDDFYSIGNTLHKEFKEYGIISNEQEWNKLQVSFLSSHDYFTASCLRNCKPQKLNYLSEIRTLVESYGKS